MWTAACEGLLSAGPCPAPSLELGRSALGREIRLGWAFALRCRAPRGRLVKVGKMEWFACDREVWGADRGVKGESAKAIVDRDRGEVPSVNYFFR